MRSTGWEGTYADVSCSAARCLPCAIRFRQLRKGGARDKAPKPMQLPAYASLLEKLDSRERKQELDCKRRTEGNQETLKHCMLAGSACNIERPSRSIGAFCGNAASKNSIVAVLPFSDVQISSSRNNWCC